MIRKRNKYQHSQSAALVIAHLWQMVDQMDTQRAVANSLGVSLSYLSQVLSGQLPPGRKLLDAIGFERVVTYQPKRGRP